MVTIVQGDDDKFKEKQADAVDMFKVCHYSKKEGLHTWSSASCCKLILPKKAQSSYLLLYLMIHVFYLDY